MLATRLDLYRTGNAFTHGSGVDDPALAAVSQMEMDFSNDPDPETAFPACGDCRAVVDLHLTLAGAPDKLAAKVQCAVCRAKTVAVDTSVPLALLSLPLLARLFRLKVVAEKDRRVDQLEELLRTEFESRWEDLRRRQRTSQASLFETRQGGELI